MSVRFAPELMQWVKDQGGATFVRHAIGELRELAEEGEFQRWWERLRLDSVE